MTDNFPTFFLGVGNAALAVAGLVGSEGKLTGTTRSRERFETLGKAGIEPCLIDQTFPDYLKRNVAGSLLLVSFPPDGNTDGILAPLTGDAERIIYISSTGVYGQHKGVVNETTEVDHRSKRAQLRIEAEECWRNAGAMVIRAPGLYGPGTGLHLRLKEGTYTLPGDGKNMVSRIHLEDLATMIISAFARGTSGKTYLAGDLKPATHIEVVGWLCKVMNLPLPDSIPILEAHPTLQTSRAVDPSASLEELQVTLKYPTYREGYMQCLGLQS